MKARSPTTAGSPGALSRSTIVLAILAGALPSVVSGLRVNRELWSGGLFNPDSAMRLVRLDDIIAAGAPLHAVMRDGSGFGNVLHWSHFLDSFLLLLAAPLAAIIGWHDALHLAGLAFGPLCMAALAIGVAWAIAPVTSPRLVWLGAAAVGSAPMIQGYGMLGVVHHHVLVALAPVMAAGWALRTLRDTPEHPGARQCGMAIGAWAAAGIWLSPESLPFILMAIGALWATWFATPSRPAVAPALLASGVTLTLLLALAWLVDPPAAGLLSIEPDRLSPPFVLLALAAAITAAVAQATGRRLPVLLCGSALAAAWLLAFPQFLRGTSGLMTPEQAHAFFDHIGEMQPVHGLDGALEALLGGAFAAVALSIIAWRAARADQTPLLFAAACAVLLLLIASTHVRFAAYPAVAGAALLPVVLSIVSAAMMAPTFRSLARVAIILLLIVAPSLAPLTASAGPLRGAADQGSVKHCSLAGAVALLAAHPGEIVLSDVNDAPDLLYRTRVRTVGSLYHRNPEGFLRLRAAWLETPGDSPGPALRATGATLVLGCPGEPRSPLVEQAPATTLQDRLIADDPPAWLHRLGDAGPNGPVLYAVSYAVAAER